MNIYERAMKLIEDDNKRMCYAITANRLKIIRYENSFEDILRVLEDESLTENKRKNIIKDIAKTALKGEVI